MPFMSVGDMAQSLLFSRQGYALKTAKQTLSTEATTGLVSDQTARLKGNFVPIAGIEASLGQLEAFRSVTSETLVIANVMQTALGTISEQASTLGSAMLAGATSPSALQIDALGRDAAHRLDTAMSALNTRVGARSLFAGQMTDRSAVTGTDAMMTAIEAAVSASGAVSSGDVEAVVNAWFDDPAGFVATTYQGGEAVGPVPVGTDQSAQIDVTAKDPAIIDTLKGLALGALLSRGVLAGSDGARADLARRAGERLAGVASPLAELGARLGSTEAAIQNAATRNDAEKEVLQSARLNLLSVDPYETAAKFQETQSQLQTLYSLTARTARLRLVDFL